MDVDEMFAVVPTIKNMCVKRKGSETFSGFKKRDVSKEFEKTLIQKDFENAIYLCVEMHITGSYKDALNILIEFFINYGITDSPEYAIHMANYLNKIDRIIKHLGSTEAKLRTINSNEFRNVLSSMVIELIEMKSSEGELKKRIRDTRAFDTSQISSNIMEHKENFHSLLKNVSLQEIKIALNEVLYAIYVITNNIPWKYDKNEPISPRHFQNPIAYFDYWIKWIVKWEKFITHNASVERNYMKKNLVFNEELYKINVPSNGGNHWIWFIWDFFMRKIEHNNQIPKMIFHLSKAMLILTRYKFSWTKSKVRYYCLRTILDMIYENKPVILKKKISPLLIFTQLNINIIYQSMVPEVLWASNIESYRKLSKKLENRAEREEREKTSNSKNQILQASMNRIDELLINQQAKKKNKITDYFV